jgi:hypothetical protein
MNKEKVFEIIDDKVIKYGKQLKSFIDSYFDAFEKIINDADIMEDSFEEQYLIKELEYWLDDVGNSLWVNSIEQLDDSSEERVNDFIELYSFLMQNSMDDVEKIIDYLFYLPERFFDAFKKDNIQRVGEVNEKDNNYGIYESNYKLIRMGIFEEIPFSYKWRIGYEN